MHLVNNRFVQNKNKETIGDIFKFLSLSGKYSWTLSSHLFLVVELYIIATNNSNGNIWSSRDITVVEISSPQEFMKSSIYQYLLNSICRDL